MRLVATVTVATWLLFRFTGAKFFQFGDNSISLDLELRQLQLFIVANRAFCSFLNPTISDVLH